MSCKCKVLKNIICGFNAAYFPLSTSNKKKVDLSIFLQKTTAARFMDSEQLNPLQKILAATPRSLPNVVLLIKD
jgi:hypothetical protein